MEGVLGAYCWDNISDRKQLDGRRVYFWSHSAVTVHLIGEAWWQECEAAGHMTSTVGREEEEGCWCSPPFSLLFSLGPQPMELYPNSVQ